MGRLPTLKPNRVLRALLRAGFYIHHQTGSHAQLRNKDDPKLRVTIPIHNKDIPKRTLTSIIRQAGLTIDKFLEYL